jgi:thiol-disulfide isomerase/thioredoxin
MAAIDVSSESEFDSKISGAGDKLVIIDYSTTWCGPCKVIAPKFDELSDKYSDSIFIKVRGFDVRANDLQIYEGTPSNIDLMNLLNRSLVMQAQMPLNS